MGGVALPRFFSMPTYKDIKGLVISYLSKDTEANSSTKIAKNLFMTMHKS